MRFPANSYQSVRSWQKSELFLFLPLHFLQIYDISGQRPLISFQILRINAFFTILYGVKVNCAGTVGIYRRVISHSAEHQRTHQSARQPACAPQRMYADTPTSIRHCSTSRRAPLRICPEYRASAWPRHSSVLSKQKEHDEKITKLRQ